jgi:PleD family two-component response regulator
MFCSPVTHLEDRQLRFADVSRDLIRQFGELERHIASGSECREGEDMERADSSHEAAATPFRVLIIDDDETITALARLSLAKNGLDVKTANLAEEGLELTRSYAPDLVVCDVVMPDLLGWEVVRRIREFSDVPVLMLSGRDSDVDKVRGLDLGADDYLTKPFTFLEFEARVRALLRRVERDSGRQPTQES